MESRLSWWWCRVFENHRKKSHSTLRAKRATFTFLVDKSSLKMPKIVNLASFWNRVAFSETALPDRLILILQKLVENAKIEKLKCDIFSYFQPLCTVRSMYCKDEDVDLRLQPHSQILHFLPCFFNQLNWGFRQFGLTVHFSCWTFSDDASYIFHVE